VGVIDQRLKQFRFIFEIIVKGRFGDSGGIDDFLHRGGGITAIGKAPEGGKQ